MICFRTAGLPLTYAFLPDSTHARRATDFLAIMADPNHQEHATMIEWVGGAFDPTAFDYHAINARFSTITP